MCTLQDLMRGMRHGYASHARRQALSKVDVNELRYSRTVDLSRYSCIPVDVAFSALCEYRRPAAPRHAPRLPVAPLIGLNGGVA